MSVIPDDFFLPLGTNTFIMKKFLAALFFLIANSSVLFAASAYHSDDWIIILGPVIVIAIIGTMYLVKTKLKERRENEARRIAEESAGQSFSSEELPKE